MPFPSDGPGTLSGTFPYSLGEEEEINRGLASGVLGLRGSSLPLPPLQTSNSPTLTRSLMSGQVRCRPYSYLEWKELGSHPSGVLTRTTLEG